MCPSCTSTSHSEASPTQYSSLQSSDLHKKSTQEQQKDEEEDSLGNF